MTIPPALVIRLNIFNDYLDLLFEHPPVGKYLTSLTALVVIALFSLHPAPGIAVAFLALPAAMVIAREKGANGIEKATWMLLIMGCLIVDSVCCPQRSLRA